MKKSLFAVAALTAIAGTAQAQSSVTVYGLLDAGYTGGNSKATKADGTVTKSTYSQFGQNNEQTSRLGFKGNEDLGGGASAFFTVEMGLTPQSANVTGSGTVRDLGQNTTQNAGSTVDNRQSFVGLKKNGIGQFAFGRQYTPIFNAGAATDASQYANVVGNVIYQGNSTVPGDAQGGMYGANNQGFTNRADNALTAKSDTFAGFSVSGLYAMNNTNTGISGYSGSTAGGNVNWSGWGLGADYTWQKLYATVAYQSFKTQNTNAIGSSSTQTAINPGAGPSGGYAMPVGMLTTTGVNLSDKQTYAAATYDFGILKAYAQWVGRKIQQDGATGVSAGALGAQLNRNAEQIGVRSYITPTIEAWGSVGMGKYTGPIAANLQPASVSFIGWQLGSNYYLSKRTNLYAIYGQSQTTSATGGTAGSGSSLNNYALGVRHTF